MGTMDRSAVGKLLLGFLVFCGVFLGLATLGVYLIDNLLTSGSELSPESDFEERSPVEDRVTAPVPVPLPRVGTSSSPSPPSPHIAQLIRQLGSPRYRERVAAENALVALGTGAVPDLEQALAHADPEIRWRAKEALRRIRERR
jgi:hypothetical protein